MTTAQIQAIQTKIGVTPDGFWGPKSTSACKAYLRSLMPSPHPFPLPEDVTSFYGPHGVKGGFAPPTKKIPLPFTIYYTDENGTKPVNSLSPHENCADSLLRVFNRLAVAFPDESSRRAAGILTYNGLYNPRPMRNGTAWSMHSWAIAIDLDMGRNDNLDHWPMKSAMPLEVMECFAREGWMPAGAFWNRDAMHFQATR